MAEDKNAKIKEQLKTDRESREKSFEASVRKMTARPTPTQEENDVVASGGHIETHEPDGSEETGEPHKTRHMEAERPSGGYQTRGQTARTPTPHSTS